MSDATLALLLRDSATPAGDALRECLRAAAEVAGRLPGVTRVVLAADGLDAIHAAREAGVEAMAVSRWPRPPAARLAEAAARYDAGRFVAIPLVTPLPLDAVAHALDQLAAGASVAGSGEDGTGLPLAARREALRPERRPGRPRAQKQTALDVSSDAPSRVPR